jgi:hypothetical protein
MPKEIKYATIPATFDETKHYIEQLAPVDMGDYLWVDVVVKDLELTDALIEMHAPVESSPEPLVDMKEQAIADINKATTIAGLKNGLLKYIDAE